jgi:hypothetical protein
MLSDDDRDDLAREVMRELLRTRKLADPWDLGGVADDAYRIADAMIAKSKEPMGNGAPDAD